MDTLRENPQLIQLKQNLLKAQDKRFKGEETLVIRWLPSNFFYKSEDKKRHEKKRPCLPYNESKNSTLSYLMSTSRYKPLFQHEVVLIFDWTDTTIEMEPNISYFKYPPSPKQVTIKQYQKFKLILNIYNTRDKEGKLYRDKLQEGLDNIEIKKIIGHRI